EPEGEVLGRQVEQLVRLRPRPPEPAEREEYGGQPLLRAVVQVPLDPPPLGIGEARREARIPLMQVLPGRLHPIGARPECSQRVCEPLGFDPMRRVEVVSLLEYLELEVLEDTAEPGCDRRILVGIAQPAKREVDRTVEASERVVVEVVRLEGLHEGPDPAGTLDHPGREVSWRRWGQLYSRLDGEPRERAHELFRRERLEPVVLA